MRACALSSCVRQPYPGKSDYVVKQRSVSRWRQNWSLRRPAWLLFLVGAALVAIGVVRVVLTASGSGLVAMIVVGGVLLISPFVVARVERVAVSASGFELPLARQMASVGAPRAARLLDRTELGRFAESCRFVQAELDDAKYRDAWSHLENRLVDQGAELASAEKFDPAEVRALFASDDPAIRVLALGLMKGAPDLADGATLLTAIADPKSANEQYQGLALVKVCWPHLSKTYRTAIRSVIEGDIDVPAGSARRVLADEILALPLSDELIPRKRT
jgi:hypothetical protein